MRRRGVEHVAGTPVGKRLTRPLREQRPRRRFIQAADQQRGNVLRSPSRAENTSATRSAWTRRAAKSGRLVLVGAGTVVRKVLGVLGLTSAFEQPGRASL